MATTTKHVHTVAEKIAALNIHSSRKRILEELMADPIGYMPDEKFSRHSLMDPIMQQEVNVLPGGTLKPNEETTLFLQFNYSRHRMNQVRRKLLKSKRWDIHDVCDLLEWNQKQLVYRSKIVTSNMGLVLAMAKRAQYQGVEFTDLISEGSMALLRASEKFDVSRGLKFSTYACQAIFKGFSRAAKQTYRHHNMFPAQWDPALEKDDSLDQQRLETHSDLVDEVRAIVNHNLADLTDTELSIVRMRFSLEDTSQTPLTLKQVGDKLGLTKERIRQIQNKALAKLRLAAEERMLNN